MANRVTWSYSATGLFLQYLIEEKNSGNWAGKSATRRGYDNVAEKLRLGAGLDYNRTQLKNKFDSLRGLFHLYHNMFIGQTGAGYDFALGTITMPDAWWEAKIAENPRYRKFKMNGLEHGELMYTVFRDSSATGEYNYTPTAFTPSSSNPPSFTPSSSNPPFNPPRFIPSTFNPPPFNPPTFNYPTAFTPSTFNPLANRSCHDETTGGAYTPLSTPPSTPRLADDDTSPPRDNSGGSRLSGTKRKSSGDMSWNNTLDSMNRQFAEFAAQTEYTHIIKKDNNNDQVEQAMDMLFRLPGVVPGDRLFKLGIKIIEHEIKRNVFVHMRTDEQRLMYLQMQDE